MAAPEHVPTPRRTRVELAVLAIVCLSLTTFFLPDLLESPRRADIAMDAGNQQRLYQWLLVYAAPTKAGQLPTAGGHRLLLDTWVRGVIEHTPANFDRFFTPGRREHDSHWRELRKRLLRGEPIWQRAEDLSSLDTHYAARAAPHAERFDRANVNEAWIANDNEGGWSFPQGTVMITYANGAVRPLSLQQMQERFGWPGLDEVFPTYGERSPHPELKQLAN